jgi:hypothetical protein
MEAGSSSLAIAGWDDYSDRHAELNDASTGAPARDV